MDGFAVDQHRATAAVTCLAAPLRAGKTELIAKKIQQQS
jgi:DNA-binding IclR family transcriptional regulator